MGVGGGSVRRLPQPNLVEDQLEAFAIFGGVDHVGAGPDDLHARRFESPREVQRSLATELHDHTVGLHSVTNIEDIFGRKWLEEEDVRRVVVGGDSLGIGVHHDALDPQFAQSE